MKRLMALWAGVVLLSLLVVPFAAAQEQTETKSALSVSPAIMEYVVEPGQTATFQITVTNTTSFPLPIKGEVRNFSVLSEDLEKTDKDRLDASAWFTLEEPEFILQPNQARVVKGSFSPPTDAVPGGHYATVYFQPLIPHEALSPATAYLNSKIGVLALMIVKGDVTEKAEYAGGLRTSRLIRHGPAQFKFAIHNTGTVHLMPAGKLVIYNRDGQEIDHIDVPAGMILPNATKEYTLSWSGHGTGHYRTELQMSYGSEQVALPKIQNDFWIAPWVEVLSGILLMIGFGVFLYKTRRRWRRAWRALRTKES